MGKLHILVKNGTIFVEILYFVTGKKRSQASLDFKVSLQVIPTIICLWEHLLARRAGVAVPGAFPSEERNDKKL